MAETIIVRSTSGVLFEFDVPTTAHAKERLDQQIAKGDLSVVPRDAVEWVTRPDGSMSLVDRVMSIPSGITTTIPIAGPPPKDELVARARELGIEPRGNWGVAKLTEAIASAVSAAQQPAGPEVATPEDDGAAAAGDGAGDVGNAPVTGD